MITVILSGRLGNLLFQYAAGRRLAVKNNTTLRLNLIYCMKKRDMFARRVTGEMGNFSITATYHWPVLKLIGLQIRGLFGMHPLPFCEGIYQEKHWGFDPDVLSLGDGTCLSGLFQSEKYFKDIEQIIRNDLRFRRPLRDNETSVYADDIMNSNSVGVHVRRADYLKSEMHNVCGVSYYARSIRYMQDRLDSPRFFVFSDDIEWCRKNIRVTQCIFVDVQASKTNPVVDFQLMSSCKHAVISNSTFSWWAAWLNNSHEKIVVAPNRWFNDEDKNKLALRDTIPDDWVRIDV